jgi:NhaA family Na+:H+ antiporter
LIVPLFALANAGVVLSAHTVAAAVTGVVGLGILLGLLLGKPLGIVLASLGAVRSRLSLLPATVGWDAIVGMGTMAGIGFTVALFISELAFVGEPARLAQAKVAILLASVVAGVLGWLVFRLGPSSADGAD